MNRESRKIYFCASSIGNLGPHTRAAIVATQILIAHNDTLFREALAAGLSLYGYAVEGYGDPVRALSAFANNPDVVLLITRVDFGDAAIDGFSLAMRCTSERPDLKILFAAKPEYREAANRQGVFVDYGNLGEALLSARRLLGSS